MTARTYLYLIFIILLIPFPGYGGGNTDGKDNLIFTTVLLTGAETGSIPSLVSARIINKLESESNFKVNGPLTPGKDINNYNCIKRKCVAEIARIVPGGIAIIISLEKKEIRTGEKQHSRYVAEDMYATRYTLHVAAVNIPAGRYDLTFKRSVYNVAGLTREADLIGEKIRDFYLKRKKEAKDIKTAVFPVPRTEDKIIKVGNEKSADLFEINGITVAPSLMYPLGDFNGIADIGYGLKLEAHGAVPSFKSMAINPGMSFYYMETRDNSIQSAYMILPGVIFGYNFGIIPRLFIMPLAGIGYSFMVIDGTAANGPSETFYYNPEFRIGARGEYFVAGRYSVVCGMVLHCIAEKSSAMFFTDFTLGIRISF